MNNSYHYLMLLNHLSYQKKVFDYLTESGLSLGEPKVLEFLAENNGCSQKKIAQGCQIEPASVTSIMMKMENEHLIYREKLNGNKKTSYVFLTELGKEKAKEVIEVFYKVEAEVFDGISEEEKLALIEIMKKINVNLMGDFLTEKRI